MPFTTPLPQLPCPRKKDGWALAGNHHFPGPGWSGEFRTRPTNLFDLAAKLHDLAFELNGLQVNLTGARSAILQSRKERADMMFRLMNRHAQVIGLWNFGSKLIFDGLDRKKFLADDGYVSVLHPTYLAQLSNPADYLMIPYSRLPGNQRPVVVTPRPASRATTQAFLAVETSHPDYSKEVPFDRQRPFQHWLQTEYQAVWSDLISL